MALVPMDVEVPDSQHSPAEPGLGGESADLDSAADVQLIAKTTRLSIGEFENEADRGVALNPSEEPTRCPDPEVHVYAGDMEVWREDPQGTRSGRAPVVLTHAPFSSAREEAGSRRWSRDDVDTFGVSKSRPHPKTCLMDLPNEVLFHILNCLEVCDLLATSRTSHRLRTLSLAPYIHRARLRRTRLLLPPMLSSPSRPSLRDLMRRSIVLTRTEFASRRLAHNLAGIRLARRLAARPSAEALVERAVLPPECLPCRSGISSTSSSSRGSKAGMVVAPALVARKRAVERERVKDGLRRWVGNVWRGEVGRREEGVRLLEERAGVGRVWRLRRYWERVGRGDV